ncbi:Rha family transcriptional regulator [Erwinia aphidicola]
MTSREIAELTGKQHAHVMRDIEVMLEQLNESAEGCLQIWMHPKTASSTVNMLLTASTPNAW